MMELLACSNEIIAATVRVCSYGMGLRVMGVSQSSDGLARLLFLLFRGILFESRAYD